MKYLLDTHVMLNIFHGEETVISEHTKSVLSNQKNQFFASAVSVWEIAIKYAIKKLELTEDPRLWLIEAIIKFGWQFLHIEPHHALAVLNLPFYHHDPFDRLLIAQAVTEDLPILSSDIQFKKYKIKVVW